MVHMIDFLAKKNEYRKILTSVEKLNPIISEICEYSQLLSGNINRIAGEHEGPELNKGDSCIFVAMAKVVIENNTFATIVRLDVQVSKSTKLQREFLCTKFYHVSTMIFPGSFEFNSVRIRADLERFAAALSEGALPVYLMGDVTGRIFHSQH